MKKILSLILLIVSIQSFGQNPPGYQSRIVRERIQGSFMADSGLHIRRYCGNPSSVIGGVSIQNGAVAIDTCGNRLYIYSGGAWSLIGGDTLYIFKKGIVAFYDDFLRSSIGNNYTSSFPGATSTISTDGLNIRGNPDNYLNYISRKFSTASENFEITLTYVNNSISTTDSGIAIGVKSQNTICCQLEIMAGVNQATGHPDLGKSYIIGRGSSYRSTGTNAISSISVGDTIELKFKRNALTYSINTRNITTGETSTDRVVTTIGLIPSTFYPNNTSLVTIYFFSGDINVIGEEYRLFDKWDADYAFVGNSITQGQAATAYNKTFANRTFEKDSGITVITSAGGGDITQSVINRLPELYNLKPRHVVLMMGGNDIYFGVSASVWKANLLAIRDSLVNHGIGVIHVAPTPRETTDMTPLRNYIDTCTAFQNDIRILETFDSMMYGGGDTRMRAAFDAGDGVHLNDSGHHYVALKIRKIVTPSARISIPIITKLTRDGANLIATGKLITSEVANSGSTYFYHNDVTSTLPNAMIRVGDHLKVDKWSGKDADGFIQHDGKGHMGVHLYPRDYKDFDTNKNIDSIDHESLHEKLENKTLRLRWTKL